MQLCSTIGSCLLIALGWFALLSPPVAQASDLVWTEEDWSQGAYASAEAIDAHIWPGRLVLASDPHDMRFVAEPTGFQGIYAMAAYHDTLFLGACEYPITIPGADILAYDYLTDSFTLDYQLNEEGVIAMKVYGDTLWIPGPEALDTMQWGNVYGRDASDWTMQSTVPGGTHVFDLAVADGIVWAAGGHIESAAAVWRSDDWGATFTEAFRIPYADAGVRRFYGCEVFDGTLYVQPDGRGGDSFLVRYDGVEWDSLAIPSMPVDKQGVFVAWGDSLIYSIANRMYFIEGDTVAQAWQPFSGNRWCRSLHRFGNALYGGALNGEFYRWRPETQWVRVDQLGVSPSTEEIEACATCWGRLWVGTSCINDDHGGRLYVAAAEPAGELHSAVHDFGVATYNGTLSWEGFASGTARPRFQVRAASSLAALEAAPFIGPDGTTGSYFVLESVALPPATYGARYFQYSAGLTSPTGSDMPWIERVTIAVDSLDAAGIEADGGGPSVPAAVHRITVCPNPAQQGARIRLQAVPEAIRPGREGKRQASLAVHDLLGRRLRSTELSLDADGRGDWLWDLRDARGERVAAGCYFIRAEQAGVAVESAQRTLLVLP